MACTPPLCNGTGSWCGCNCQCCPPLGCCTEVIQTWECGTSSTTWEGGIPNEGCDCFQLNLHSNLIENENEIPFPNFTELEEDEGFVWALQGCSIPCAAVSVTITTDGCCLQVSGNNIIVVGSGTISAIATGGPIGCGNIAISVNGLPNSAYLNNCDNVLIGLVAGSPNCCECCLVSTTCTSTLFAPIVTRQQNIQSGTNKIYLNKKNLVQRINNLRRNK
jgi:hypothetical protein